jgi:hypothetical protein
MRPFLQVFECGHGDTILFRMPGDRWCLVDCNLSNPETGARLFQAFRDWNINSLYVVVVTHYHIDHYCGMDRIIEYFCSPGRSIGNLCLPLLEVATMAKILRFYLLESEVQDFERCVKAISRHQGRGIQKLWYVTEHTRSISVGSESLEARLTPIAPNELVSFRKMLPNLKRMAEGPPGYIPRMDLNELSLVYALEVKEKTAEAHGTSILLSGDLTASQWPDAMLAWNERARESGAQRCFSLIKVPHHGSYRSHSDKILEHVPATGNSFAVVSVGAEYRVLPDRSVLRAYMAAGCQVACTCRKALAGGSRAVDVLCRNKGAVHAARHDLAVEWLAGAQLRVFPSDAFVEPLDLPLYATAAES